MHEPRRSSLTTVQDERGILVAVEFDQIPFTVKRVFTIHGPETGATRGEHRAPCDQMIVNTGAGRVLVTLGDGADPIALDATGNAVLIPKGIWVEFELFDEQSSVLVLASERYVAPGGGE
jgi:hypothetical protein